jgi:regulator of nonsense transcripts 1
MFNMILDIDSKPNDEDHPKSQGKNEVVMKTSAEWQPNPNEPSSLISLFGDFQSKTRELQNQQVLSQGGVSNDSQETPKTYFDPREKLFEDIKKEKRSKDLRTQEKDTKHDEYKTLSQEDLKKMNRDWFESSQDYCFALKTKVYFESQHEKRLNTDKSLSHIFIDHWKRDDEGIVASYFRLSEHIKIALYEKVILTWPGTSKNGENVSVGGQVCKIPDRESMLVGVTLDNPILPPRNQKNNFGLTFCFNRIPFERTHQAISDFDRIPPFIEESKDGLTSLFIASVVKRMILGLKYKPLLLDSPRILLPHVDGLMPLNESQNQAVIHGLTHPLTLIQGPPGTGKTATSGHLIYYLNKFTNLPVLACAQSNAAIDNLLKVLVTARLTVVRVNSRAKEEDTGNEFPHLSLEFLVGQRNSDLIDYHHKIKGMSDKEKRKWKMLKHKIENQILNEADVVCCTCSGAGDPRVKRQKFLSCLIDECGQGTEADTIIPISLTYGRVILVGDHKQLGPVVKSDKARIAGMEVSMFERLIRIKVPLFTLDTQYRMHPAISHFPNMAFYDGKLMDGVSMSTARVIDFPWPKKEFPLMFLACDGKESRRATSYINFEEAKIVSSIVTALMKNGFPGSEIGIITAYDAQKTHLISKKIPVAVEINSVDAFQGREKEIIIMNTVRSEKVGFLKDERRMNVSLTRAKSGLIIIGNPWCLKQNKLWRKFLNHLENEGVLVCGKFGQWKSVSLGRKDKRQQKRMNHKKNEEPVNKERR